MFKDIKVGDKVYDLAYGVGKVIAVDCDDFMIKFDGNNFWYEFDGRRINVINRTLYWSKPEIIEKPRKVKKVVERWVNVSNNDDCQVVKLTGSYEIMEEV